MMRKRPPPSFPIIFDIAVIRNYPNLSLAVSSPNRSSTYQSSSSRARPIVLRGSE